MSFLYGDSTPSTLRSNFLEFLRDAIDFAVFVLDADERIKRGHAKARALREESDEELRRLDGFIDTVARSIQGAEKGKPESPTAHCATRLMGLVGDAHRSATTGIKQSLADEIARIDADEAAAREGCLQALATLLAPHEPPQTTTIRMFVLGNDGRYEVSASSSAEVGLDWAFDLEIPEGSPWASTVRVERLVSQAEIRAPQLSGWISKEVKTKPQRLERMLVTKLVDDDTTLTFHLRAEGSDLGFDFEVDFAEKKVTSTRRAPADDASAGAFDLTIEDVPVIFDLAEKLRASITGFAPHRLTSATFDEVDFHLQKDFVGFIGRFIAMLAPIVREISDRSLTPNELVIRRALGNDRREEIFVAKSTLREKYAGLMESQRALFAPLGLEAPVKPVRPPASTLDGPPPLRAELPRSVPPPKKIVSAPPKPISSNPPPVPPFPIQDARDSEPSIEVIVTPPPAPPPLPQHVPAQNEALVATLKKILMLSRNGRVEEAYADYAELFMSPAFADYRPDDQRQALKLMVFAKTPPPESDSVRQANEAARTRLTALVDALQDPNDMELLGVVHVALGDEKTASSIFQKALDIERVKNPQSELVATLMRRVSQL